VRLFALTVERFAISSSISQTSDRRLLLVAFRVQAEVVFRAERGQHAIQLPAIIGARDARSQVVVDFIDLNRLGPCGRLIGRSLRAEPGHHNFGLGRSRRLKSGRDRDRHHAVLYLAPVLPYFDAIDPHHRLPKFDIWQRVHHRNRLFHQFNRAALLSL